MMASNNNSGGATARSSSRALYDHDVGRMEVYGVTTEYDSDEYDEEESPGAVEADNNGGEEVSIGTYEQQTNTNTTPNEQNSMRKLMNRIGQGMSTGFLFRGENNNKQNSSSRSSAIDYDQRRQRSSSGGVDKKSKMTITENGEVEVTPNNNATAASTAVRGSGGGGGGKESRKQQKRSSSSKQQQQPEEISIRKNYSVGMTYEEEDEEEEFSEITTPNEGEARRIERSYETKEKRLVRRRFETCIIWILLLLSVFTMIYLGMRHRKSKE